MKASLKVISVHMADFQVFASKIQSVVGGLFTESSRNTSELNLDLIGSVQLHNSSNQGFFFVFEQEHFRSATLRHNCGFLFLFSHFLASFPLVIFNFKAVVIEKKVDS